MSLPNSPVQLLLITRTGKAVVGRRSKGVFLVLVDQERRGERNGALWPVLLPEFVEKISLSEVDRGA